MSSMSHRATSHVGDDHDSAGSLAFATATADELLFDSMKDPQCF